MRLFVLLSIQLVLQAQGVDWVREHYTKQEYRIPMRDGIKLHTSVYVPKDKSKDYPFLLMRTPYSCSPYGTDNYRATLWISEKYARSGYIFVCQDVRGRYESEGVFIEMTPNGNAINESTDTYDTVEWLLHHVEPNNGRAGIHGTSYPGFYAAAALPNAHPALKAASPQAPIIDLFRGDDSFHNGAFYLAANFGFYRFFREHKEPQRPSASRTDPFDLGTPDGYDFFLKLGPLANADEKYFKFTNPYWTANTRHTAFDDFWKARNLEPHIRNTTPAILAVGGWFDAEDLQGPLRLFRAATKNNPKAPVTLVMGPWSHGGWQRGPGSSLGPVQFGVKSGEFFRDQIEFPFFERYLKSKGDPQLPAAWLFCTGSNEWRRFEQWPPAASARTLYLHAGGKLSFEPPSANEGSGEYESDPAKPVPYINATAQGMSAVYMVADQRFAAERPDVLTFETAPLEGDVTIGGPVTARLFASTTGTDSDWIVKLIDVYPNDAGEQGGYQQLLRGEPFRGRFWKSMEKPEPLPSGEFVKIEYAMPDVLHTFRRGHRIMIQVQSSWFPLIDRNPQKFVPNIPDAKPADFVKATQRVAHNATMPSGVAVQVLSEALQ